MLVYSITVGFSPILYCYLIPCRASELLSLQPMFPVCLNIQICVHNISIIFVCACTPGLSLCCRGEPWVFTVERAYDINKAEGSCQ